MRIHREVPVHCFLQVQNHHRLCFRERISLNAASGCCCQLHINVIVPQFHPIITCIRFFFTMRELGVNAQFSLRFLIRQSNRHKGNVVQVTGTCTRQMRMAKSRYGAVGIKITGNAIPTGKTIVRTKLHHTERHLCTGISITCIIRTDKRIDYTCIIN